MILQQRLSGLVNEIGLCPFEIIFQFDIAIKFYGSSCKNEESFKTKNVQIGLMLHIAQPFSCTKPPIFF